VVLLTLGLALALALPIPALATTETATPGSGDAPTFDTPAPTQAPTDPGPGKTPKPERTPKPTKPPVVAFAPLVPDRAELHVGYTGSGVLAQAPLLLAEEAGYFDEAGLTNVTIVRTGDVLNGVRVGDLDIAVVDKTEALAAWEEDPALRAIAGYRNYDADGTYGGDLLLAAPGLAANEPATVIAFLSAYIRALDLLDDTKGGAEAYALIEETDLVLSVKPDAWADALNAYAPFDGGFGSLEDEAGWGELVRYLGTDEPADLEAFVSTHALSIAQTWQGLPADPANALAGAPGVAEITVGMPLADGETSPIATALDLGYFEDAGFASVEVIDVEAPLLGVLQGKIDFGILDTIDTAEATEQGLPLLALAGHRNYDEGGGYGGDLLIASADLLGEEGSTASAFLIAYVRALMDLADDPEAAAFAPFDGGMGDRTQLGGLGEMYAYLSLPFEPGEDVAALADARPLEYAQAWWGLPANPTLPFLAAEEAE